MSKNLQEMPIRPVIVDYTWRSRGVTIVRCPVCRYHGQIENPKTTRVRIIHKEIMRTDGSLRLLEYCWAPQADVKKALEKKVARRGQSIVEISLLMPFFCLLLFGTLDIGRLIQAQARVTNAAHLAMR